MNFFFLIMVTWCLFVRPSEIVPQFSVVPLYELMIVPCILLSLDSLLGQFAGESLRRRPVTVCVLGLWLAIVLADLSHFAFETMYDYFIEFGKVVLFYLLVAGLVNTRERLSKLMACIVAASVVVTVLAVLHYHGVIDNPAFEAMDESWLDDPLTGEPIVYRRLCGPGLFHDPNDVSLIHAVNIMFCLYGASDRRRGVLRFAWLLPILLFGYAFTLTHSRGGLIALIAGLLALFVTRLGAVRAGILSAALLPLVFVLIGGRQASIDTGSGTSQGRIQIWMEGLMLFRGAPLFGIGNGQYGALVGHVAHNSYVQAYTELGLFGGVLFVGAFYYSLTTIFRLCRAGDRVADPELRRMGPYLLAATSSYTAGMLSLSENYLVTTYAILGLATAYIGLTNPDPPLPNTWFDRRMALRLVVVGVVTLVVIFLFTKYTVNWD